MTNPFILTVNRDNIVQVYMQVAAKSKDFCSLSRDQISRLISSEKLLVSSEGEVYKAVVSIESNCIMYFPESDPLLN